MTNEAAGGQAPFLALVSALALALFVGHAVWLSPAVGLNAGDEVEYHLLAKALAQGKGLTYDGHELTSFRPPLLPAYLAAAYRVFGPSPVAGRVAVAALCATLPLLLFWTALVYLGDLRCARLSAILALVYWPFVRYSGQLMSDLPFVCLLLAFLIPFGLMLRDLTRVGPAVAAGAALGLAVLCRPTVLLLPIWLLPLLLAVRERKLLLRNVAALSLTAGLVVAPWSLRNYAVHGELVLVSTQGGYALWQHHNELPPDGTVGTNPAIQDRLHRTMPELLERVRSGEPADEVFREILGWRGKGYVEWLGEDGAALREEFRGLNEPQTDRLLKRKALEAIRAHPGRFLRKVAKSCLKFWEPYGDPDVRSGTRRYNLAYGLVAPLGAIGTVSLLRKRRFPWAFALVAANFNALVALFYYEERYRLPVEPCLIVLATVGIVALSAMRRSVSVAVVSALVLANGAILLWGESVMEALREFVHAL